MKIFMEAIVCKQSPVQAVSTSIGNNRKSSYHQKLRSWKLQKWKQITTIIKLKKYWINTPIVNCNHLGPFTCFWMNGIPARHTIKIISKEPSIYRLDYKLIQFGTEFKH